MDPILTMYIFEEKLWLYNVLSNNLFVDSYKCLLGKGYTTENKIEDVLINERKYYNTDEVIIRRESLNFLIEKIFRKLD